MPSSRVSSSDRLLTMPSMPSIIGMALRRKKLSCRTVKVFLLAIASMRGRLDRRGQSSSGHRRLCRRTRSGRAWIGRGDPEATGRPSYHPSVLLKLYIYGYLNRVQSSRRLEREAGRNVEVVWLTGRLVPDHKTIADFRKDNGRAIRRVCARFVALCRATGLFAEEASVAIDGSKFNVVGAVSLAA